MEHLASSFPLWMTDDDVELHTYAYTDTGESVLDETCVIDVTEFLPAGSDLLFLEVVWEDRTDENVDIEHQIELRKQELRNDADATVASDMKQSVNTRPDSVSFYPPL
ncbi:hypothetical protein JYU09_01480 [bacterium AH-315-O15]|nr:hypothetical protein [bacterium AH-315-O15]